MDRHRTHAWLRIAAGTALLASGASLALLKPERPAVSRGLDWIAPALAATTLNPSAFSDLATSEKASQMAKWLYFLVNGPNSDYTISGAPANGLVGIITGLTDTFGQVIHDSNLVTDPEASDPDCTDVLTSGTTTFTASARTWAITLGTGTDVVPSHFQSRAGQTYTNKLDVTRDGSPFMKLEFTCTSREDYSGYLLLVQSGTDRDIETYFERNVSTGASTIDVAMVNNDGTGEKLWTRFRSTDGDTFTLHAIRTTTSADSHAFSVVGTRSSNKALIGGVNVTDSTAIDDSTALSASFPSTTTCVDISSDDTTTGCQSALATPASGPLGSMTSGVSSYSAAAVSSMSLSALTL